jgi:hypothetical protein
MADSTSDRGLANADEQTRKEVASKGGQASPANFKNDRQKAREAGRKGGEASRRDNV